MGQDVMSERSFSPKIVDTTSIAEKCEVKGGSTDSPFLPLLRRTARKPSLSYERTVAKPISFTARLLTPQTDVVSQDLS